MTGPAFVIVAMTLGCARFKNADVGADAATGDAPADGPGATTFAVVQQAHDAGALNAVWGSGPTDIHAVGDNGAIVDYDGTSWTPLAGSVTGATLTGVWGTGPNDVYAVGTLAADSRGIIFHDDGTGWVQQESTAHGLLSVWGVSGAVYAVGLGGAIYRRVGSGAWTLLGSLPPNPYVDAGPGAPVLWSVNGNASNEVVVAAGLDSTFLDDGQSQWLYSYDPVDRTRDYRCVWGAPSQSLDVFIGANYYGIWWWLEASDGGVQSLLSINEEHDEPDDVARFLWGIWGPSSDRAVFVGDAGRIMYFDGSSGPNSAQIIPSPVATTLYGVWGVSMDDVWIVGKEGTILHGSIPLP
jgi:hypothetical protein